MARIRQPAQWPEAEGVAQQWTETVWWNLIRNALMHGGEGPVAARLESRGNRCDPFPGCPVPVPLPPESVSPRLLRPFHQLHQNPFGRLRPVRRRADFVTLQGGQCGYETSSDDKHDGAIFSRSR